MSSYYYLIASLPDLRSDGEMPISYEEFLTMCQSNVSDDKYELLAHLTLSSTEGPVVKEWADFYGSLKGELNYQRSVSLGKPYTTSYDMDSMTAQIASAALSAKNPLEAEKIMLDYEFDQLDGLVGLHAFDDHVLFGYAIKLKLLERQSCFEHEKGEAEFRRLIGVVQDRVYGLGIS